MIYLYDKAMENKLKKVFPNTVYAPVDKFYERYLIGNQNSGPIKLPALSIWRTSHEFFPFNARTQVSVPNFKIRHDDEFRVRNIFSMQIVLRYELDIWAATDIDRDDLMKELLFFLVSYPNIFIEYQGQKFEFPIQVEAPSDTTEIAEFDSNGDLYRISMPLVVNDARLLFYQDAKTCKYIDLSYYTNDDLSATSEIGKRGS